MHWKEISFIYWTSFFTFLIDIRQQDCPHLTPLQENDSCQYHRHPRSQNAVSPGLNERVLVLLGEGRFQVEIGSRGFQ